MDAMGVVTVPDAKCGPDKFVTVGHVLCINRGMLTIITTM